MFIKDIQSALAVGLGVAAFAATVPVAHAQTGIEEVFVTARKRDEGAQSVPISISALSSEALEQRNVRELQDLNVVVPGFRFGASGGKSTNDIIMRGLSKIPLGEGVAAVVTYFANVALPPTGSNIPTYDIANMQVLKGPQGTLFGRNTLGGAVVITPEAPNYTLGGYVRGAYGSENYRVAEGALNVPLVDDKAALRVAGQTRRRDGLNKNLSGGKDFDDIHQNSYRVSLLLQPTDNIESTTVYDHLTGSETAASGYLMAVNEPALTGLQQQFDFLGTIGVFPAGQGTAIAQQVRDYVAAGQRAGIHAGFSDLENNSVKRNLWGVSNDTSWNLDGVTLRNVFGYRRASLEQADTSSGVGRIFMDVYAPPPAPPGFAVTVPFTLFSPSQPVNRKYISDEFQVFGNAFDDRLDWIVGAFYNLDKSAGENGTTFTSFSPGGIPAAAITAHVENENKAVFTQIGLDISEWTLDGLKFNLGARYSTDDVWACGGGNPAGYMGVGECEDIAHQNNPYDGIGVLENDGSEVSWTVGLDWQLSPDTLLYVTSRAGYRGVNVNTPLFETPYTTGGTPLDVMTSPLGPLLGPCIGDTGAGPGAINCPDLRPFQKTDPEKITDIEVGIKNDWSIGEVRGRLNVSAYIMQYDDAVQFLNTLGSGIPNGVPDAPTSSSVGVNAADLEVKGVEADLTIVPVPSLTLILSGAYTDQKVDKLAAPTGSSLSLSEDGITLPSPEFSGTFAFNWTLPVRLLDGELILNGDYYHTDDFGGQGGINVPGYDVTNFRLNWNGIGKSGLDLAVYVKNAFDEEYFIAPKVFLSYFPTKVAMPGDERTWGVEASYKF